MGSDFTIPAIRWFLGKLLLLTVVTHPSYLMAVEVQPRPGSASPATDGQALQSHTSREAASTIRALLQRYCPDQCMLIKANVVVHEDVVESDDLGFESDADLAPVTSWTVDQIIARIQIDRNVTQRNVERLESILKNHLTDLAPVVQIEWATVEAPRIGKDSEVKDAMANQLESRMRRAIMAVFDKYCPEDCQLNDIEVLGDLITADEVQGLAPSQFLRDQSSGMFMRINTVAVHVAMNEKLAEAERQRISGLLRERLAFASPVDLSVSVLAFPESFADRQKRLREDADDPYGLEKLRETLSIFRDLAGTKEIISSTDRTESGKSTETVSDWWVWVLALALLAGALAVVKWRAAAKDAEYMDQLARSQKPSSSEQSKPATALESKDNDLKSSLEADQLKSELLEIFMKSPKVARETFGRILQEEGVEQTAKYVEIFGKMVVFELLDDPNQRRNLYALSEYFHKSNFRFQPVELVELLEKLRTKVTANEIKLMARQINDQFEFLARLDAGQVFALIRDEMPRIQSIVLTQLDGKRRQLVFDQFEGDAKLGLMKELCQGEAIPRDFLANVARAMQKKIRAKPEFDTENVRSNDILLDLLERSDFAAQVRLIADLQENNPDASRSIKKRLVTVHILKFLKEGQLLEIILGMDRNDLLIFLAGAEEDISRLLLSKAPDELAESWREDLASMSGIDGGKYRVVEMQILGRLRNMAGNGMFNLLEINELIYQADSAPIGGNGSTDLAGQIPSQPMGASRIVA